MNPSGIRPIMSFLASYLGIGRHKPARLYARRRRGEPMPGNLSLSCLFRTLRLHQRIPS
jgi:hypothetical protein